MSKSERFINWCDKLMAFSFYALVYFLPISIALSETFTALAFFGYLLKRGGVFCGLLRGRGAGAEQKNISIGRKLWMAYKPVPDPLNTSVYIFLLVNLISVVLSQYLLLSIEGFIGKVLQSMFLYFNFVECMRSNKRIKIFLSVLLVSCTLIVMNGVYQYYAGHEFFFGHDYIDRIYSSFRHANDFGAYLVMLIPIIFSIAFLFKAAPKEKGRAKEGLAYFSGRGTRFLIFILFAAAMVCLGLTLSRGAWIGLIVSILFFGATNRKALLIYGLAIIVFLGFFYPRLTTYRAPINNKKSFEIQNNRLRYWERAADIIKDYPYFGSGVNTYALVEGRYSTGWGGYPHNSFLQMTSDTGLIGVASFIWMLLVLFWNCLSALKHSTNHAYKMLLIGAATGLLGFLIHSFFDTNFYSVQLGSLMWVMMGFIMSVRELSLDPNVA